MPSTGDKEKAQAVWGASPAGWTWAPDEQPGTREFFEKVLSKRSSYELPWLFELVPFASYRGKAVIELGCGAGYDAYEFCRNGADYTGIDITPANPGRTRGHLGHFGLAPKVLQADAESLPFPAASFDVAFSNGVLHHTPDIRRSFREAYRVLRPGGELWVAVYHKNSIFYLLSVVLVHHVLGLGFLRRSLKDRRSMIETSTSGELPLVNVYTRKEVARLLEEAGFPTPQMRVRKLVREDFPGIPLVSRLWRHLPQRWLDQLGQHFGWYVVAHAKKP